MPSSVSRSLQKQTLASFHSEPLSRGHLALRKGKKKRATLAGCLRRLQGTERRSSAWKKREKEYRAQRTTVENRGRQSTTEHKTLLKQHISHVRHSSCSSRSRLLPLALARARSHSRSHSLSLPLPSSNTLNS